MSQKEPRDSVDQDPQQGCLCRTCCFEEMHQLPWDVQRQLFLRPPCSPCVCVESNPTLSDQHSSASVVILDTATVYVDGSPVEFLTEPRNRVGTNQASSPDVQNLM
jgi:hypothetical protein